MIAWLTVLTVAGLAPGGDDGAAQPKPFGVATAIQDADGRSLDAFHRALARTERGEGKTRILQFGASHTAADLLTGYARRRLQARFGSGGHGWFMPARPWKTYRHQDLKFEGSKSKRRRWVWDRVPPGGPFEHADGLLGLAGMSVKATHPRQQARFRTATTGPNKHAERLELWFAKQRKGGDLYLTVNGKRKRKRIKTRGKPGLGIFELDLPRRSHSFVLKPRGNGEVRLYGAVLENDDPGVVIDTLGINGSRAVSQLAWNERLWSTLVQRRDPALIVLAYGTNESGDVNEPIRVYRRNLNRVLKRVRRAAPEASCVLFGPTDRPRKREKEPNPDGSRTFDRRPRVDQVREVQAQVAQKHGCGFFDAVEATGGTFSIVSWAHAEPRLAYGDYVHLTGRGYKRLANLFVDALLAGYESPDRPPTASEGQPR